jgi:hypothetical protein
LSRALLSLWPYYWRGLLLLAVAAFAAFAPFTAVPTLVFVSLWASEQGSGWLWRFLRHVRRFRTAVDAGLVVHYAPGLDPAALLRACREESEQLARWFEFPLRGRVVVYLFASTRDVRDVFGAVYGGTALASANAVVLANDNNLRESLRHELAHLFSFYWSEAALTRLAIADPQVDGNRGPHRPAPFRG